MSTYGAASPVKTLEPAPAKSVLSQAAFTGTFIFLLFGGVIEGMDVQLLPGSFHALEQDLSLTPRMLATLSVGQGLTQAFSGPFWGALADGGVERRRLLATGTFCWGALTMALALVNNFQQMVVLRVLNGVALGMLSPVSQSLIADMAPSDGSGRLFGLAEFAKDFGMSLSALCTTSFASRTYYGVRGWRLAFAFVAILSIINAHLTAFFMKEHISPRRQASPTPTTVNVVSGVKNIFAYWKISSFRLLVAQGMFGCIPWAALSFSTLYFQSSGISDVGSATLSTAFMVAAACGHLLGGFVGDALSRVSPLHGRPLTAQLSVLAGIPVVYTAFSGDLTYEGILLLLVILGLTAKWVAAGVSCPILAEIVGERHRGSIMAWMLAITNSSAVAIGGPLVGYLAEEVFGYNVAARGAAPAAAGLNGNATALGRAIMWCSVVPWTLCLCCFSLLHFTYAKDVTRARAEAVLEAAENAAHASTADEQARLTVRIA